ncbi:MAG TPA: ATP-binding cassette domain-containing protein [Solirubrobacteraceae bacterium]|nr:ATP-binding cassette domain-containing protein [Solirubrobacteraceae bacterium]
MSPALRFEGVTYRYPGAGAPALRDVELEVAAGEFVVLAGSSGSGKSTLLRAAAGLVPHFHGGEFGGRLEVGGLDTRTHEPAAIAAVAGTLFQDPETQVVMGTVRAELAFPLENRGLGQAAVARGVEEAALALGIAPLLDRSTHELSGGELQRVALGAALVGRPRVALLDEPTSQLDPVAGDELLGVLRRLNEEWGTAVILAEHRLERCLSAADRVVALRDGAVACDADPRGFLTWAGEHAPDLQTPGARLFALAGRTPPPVSVKDARRALAKGGFEARGVTSADDGGGPRALEAFGDARGGPGPLEAFADERGEPGPLADGGGARRGLRRRRRGERVEPALALSSVWFEHKGGATVLRGVDLDVAPGERVALMGRNGAGKSTLLRVAAGLLSPTRGKVRGGRVALLLQNPGDYALRDRVGDELPADALAAAGLSRLADRHPRDLSGGERQRLALAIVLHGERPAVVCLDEPTRGMDRGHKHTLATLLSGLAEQGSAVVVATHDAEFVAAVATRTVLLGDGRPVADAPTAEVLAGGWYFATQTARILGGAALLPEDGAALLRREARGEAGERAPSEAVARPLAETDARADA